MAKKKVVELEPARLTGYMTVIEDGTKLSPAIVRNERDDWSVVLLLSIRVGSQTDALKAARFLHRRGAAGSELLMPLLEQLRDHLFGKAQDQGSPAGAGPRVAAPMG